MRAQAVVLRLTIAVLCVVVCMALNQFVDGRTFRLAGSAAIIGLSTLLAHKIH